MTEKDSRKVITITPLTIGGRVIVEFDVEEEARGTVEMLASEWEFFEHLLQVGLYNAKKDKNYRLDLKKGPIDG